MHLSPSKGMGSKLGETGVALMAAYADISRTNTAQNPVFRTEYARQRAWQVARKWYRKVNVKDRMEDV